MRKNLKKMLETEIKSVFETLENSALGSKEYSSGVDDLVKLYRLTIEEDKSEREARIRSEECRNLFEHQKEELEIKKRELDIKEGQLNLDKEVKNSTIENSNIELRAQKIDRYIKIGISIAELVIPLMFYACWMRRGFEFEKTGTFTSTTFRGLFSHFKPIKK